MKHLLPATLLFLLVPVLAFAQAEPPPDVPKRAELKARVEAARAKLLREFVGLEEERAVQVEEAMRRFDPKRKELKQALREHKKAVRQLLKQDSNDEQAFEEALAGVRAAHKAVHELREAEYDEMARLLSAKERAKLFGGMNRMRRHLHSAFRKHRRGKRGGGMGRGPGPHGGLGGGPGGDCPGGDCPFGDGPPDMDL
jgi:uncharacterized membrane protein